MRMRCLLVTIVLLPASALGHVGSPDIYYDGYAGPYHVLITIRPPTVIPGLAQVEVRSLSPNIGQIEAVPMPFVSDGSALMPKPDRLRVSDADPEFFSGRLWIMRSGSWKIEIAVQGKSGRHELAVPLPAMATKSAEMQAPLAILLAVPGLVLVLGLVGIVRAANGEAEVDTGQTLTADQRRRAYRRAGVALLLIAGSLLLGGWWWHQEASANAKTTYRIPHVQATFEAGDRLLLRLDNTHPSGSEKLLLSDRRGDSLPDDLVPDHNHLLHLFLVRMPDLRSFWHLHPAQLKSGEFTVNLPPLPAGDYQVYADIVHQSGFPETQVGRIALPAVAGHTLSGDDSGGADLTAGERFCQLPEGYRMVWLTNSAPLRVNEPELLRFRLEDSNGVPARDMETYMGMAGHAVVISDDGGIFAHVHPQGSVSMAAMAMFQATAQRTGSDTMAGMSHNHLSAEVSFPYGFPAPGDYRIFVQVKRSGHIVTGAFLAHVNP